MHPTLYLIVVSEPLLSIQSLKNGVEKMSEGGEKFIVIKIICNCNVIAKIAIISIISFIEWIDRNFSFYGWINFEQLFDFYLN